MIRRYICTIIMIASPLLIFAQGIQSTTQYPPIPSANQQAMPGYSISSLFQNAISYLDQKKISGKNIQTIEKSNRTQITTTYEFLIYSTGLAKHPIGNIIYAFSLDIEDQYYRYWFDNIQYQPYSRNRYGRFVPVNGKQLPIEYLIKNSTREYDIIGASINKHIKKEAELLKKQMAKR